MCRILAIILCAAIPFAAPVRGSGAVPGKQTNGVKFCADARNGSSHNSERHAHAPAIAPRLQDRAITISTINFAPSHHSAVFVLTAAPDVHQYPIPPPA